MVNPVFKIFWFERKSGILSSMPEASLKDSLINVENVIVHENIFENVKKWIDKKGKVDHTVIVYDIDEPREIEVFITEINKIKQHKLVFLIVPASVSHEAIKFLPSDHNIALIQKPIKKNEFFLLLEKSILLLFYRDRARESSTSDLEWISKIEEVFELSRKELLEREKTSSAYKSLIAYEERLLDEQRKITNALVVLQEYHTKEKMEWLEEREAISNLDKLRIGEIKDRDDVVKAQENLLELSRRSRVKYTEYLKAYTKGDLAKKDVEALLNDYLHILEHISSSQN